MTNDQIFPLLFPPDVAAHFDVVSFDPRGVRRSHPIECDPDLVASLNRPTPTNQREFAALLAAQAEVGADCRHRTGALFDHLASTDVAHDVDALRKALGEPKLNIYALSYGTVVGQMYAERFPHRIRTMVLDSVFDHSVESDEFSLVGARAPHQGAAHVAAQLPGSTLVTHKGLGHGVATRTPCTADLVHRYLTERRLPPPGTHCPRMRPGHPCSRRRSHESR